MTEITAQSIDAALRKQLDAINTSVESRETGTVVQIGDGIARIDGLKGAMSGELLEFVASDGRIVSGLVQNLEEDEVGAVSSVTSPQLRKTTRYVPLARFLRFLLARLCSAALLTCLASLSTARAPLRPLLPAR